VDADQLGVHYQTAYRWVRTGRLPAQLVSGKYQVARRDLGPVAEQVRAPSKPKGPGLKRLARQSQRMHEALVAGDEATALQIGRRLVEEGTSVTELIQAVLVPPLRRIGQAWHDGQLPISVEHRAAAIVDRLLGDLAPNPRGRRRGTAVVAAVAGDLHTLPTTMATVALREHNWRVHHLGADMPADELVRFCTEHQIDVAVISLTNPQVTALANRAAHQLRVLGVPVVVGGPGRSLSDLVVDVTTATRAELD
jgi:MerR family transcriptional regulator, light-induced transcriptional regulator